jgi:hypothetical protein
MLVVSIAQIPLPGLPFHLPTIARLGVVAAVRGDIPLLDAEMPAANGVVRFAPWRGCTVRSPTAVSLTALGSCRGSSSPG